MPQYLNTEIVLDTPVYSLRHAKGNGDACFIIPPHAGRHGSVVQNLIECAQAHRDVYVFDLKPATQDTKHVSIGDLCVAISDCIGFIGYDVDLVGVCQGGWLSAIFSALYPDSIKSLALMAAPIDIQASPDNTITKFCDNASEAYFRLAVASTLGVQSGLMQWLAFALSNPMEVFIDRWSKLAWAIILEDEETVEKLKRNNEWYDSPQDLSGAWYLQAIEDLFLANKLIEGLMVVHGKKVDLKHINAPVFLYAGGKDEITSTEQLFGISKALNVPVEEILLEDAGHTKVFTGKKELKIFEETFLVDK